MTGEDLVNVLVPRRHLSRVYGLIASLEASAAGMAPGESAMPPDLAGVSAGSTGAQEWTASLVRRMVEESSPAMSEILRALTARPGEWLTMEELAKAIRHKPDADWKTVAGTLGAFGNRVRNRYSMETWPFDNRHDHKVRGRVCRMSVEMAEMIKSVLSNHQR